MEKGRSRPFHDEGQPISDVAEIEFGAAEIELIQDALRLYDKNEEINDETAPLYIKFVEELGGEAA